MILPLAFTVRDLVIDEIGMDFYVIMGRPGLRVARRKHKQGRVGAPHRINKDETVNWFKKRFDGLVLNK